jgi:hypothetical protein
VASLEGLHHDTHTQSFPELFGFENILATDFGFPKRVCVFRFNVDETCSSGMVHRRAQNAIVEMLGALSPTHPFFLEHVQGIIFDMNVDGGDHSEDDAWQMFQTTASSMFSSAGGVCSSNSFA